MITGNAHKSRCSQYILNVAYNEIIINRKSAAIKIYGKCSQLMQV